MQQCKNNEKMKTLKKRKAGNIQKHLHGKVELSGKIFIIISRKGKRRVICVYNK